MSSIPDLIFIVPYRDRESHLSMFLSHMPYILEDLNYEIYFAHQKDSRFFNRGAMKNIGFIHVKEKYPDNYKDITFVFHDVDTFLSQKGMTNFQTVKGKVKHIIGFKRAFGGVFAIKGEDFETLNGFPCIWNWGMEDNSLKLRWLRKMKKGTDKMIDYSEFYSIHSKKVIMLWHGENKIFNKEAAWDMYEKAIDFKDGINKIRNIVKKEININSHHNISQSKQNFFMINITNFMPAKLPPKKAENKPIKSIRDAHFGYNKIKRNAIKNSRHAMIRNTFSLIANSKR